MLNPLPGAARRTPFHPYALRGVLLAALLLTGGSARAQAPNGPDTLTPSDTSPDSDLVLISNALGTIELGGRLDVRESLEQSDGGAWAGKLSVPAARLEFTYRWKKRVRAVMEFDAAQGELKDAFVALKVAKGFSIRAGQFKVPLSLVELESTQKLPLVHRGLLRDVLSGALGLTGRKSGAQLEWKCSGCSDEVTLRAGAWQTQDPDKKVALSRGLGLIPTVRGTWGRGNLQLGASALYQPAGSSSTEKSSWSAALDARHTLPLGRFALRTWAEALTGRAGALGETDGVFLMGRAVTALRLGGATRGDTYLEPFLMLSALDPDLQRDADLLWEGTGGLNVGQWQLWRLQAQFETRRAGESTPALLETLDKDLVSRRALFVQLEVGF